MPPAVIPFGFPFPRPRTLEVGVAAVAGEDERDPGEAPVASISRESAFDDSRRREGILDWDLAPGGARGEFCPKLLAQVSE
jgi:hypothetical protein